MTAEPGDPLIPPFTQAGQALHVNDAMLKTADAVFNYLKNAGLIK